jgi:DNA-directed RNA polymerase alpha subunit
LLKFFSVISVRKKFHSIPFAIKIIIKKLKSEMALKTCPQGHTFNKTTDCPTCPVCESLLKPKDGFLSTLAAPARRALENNGIKTLKQLSSYTEKEILSLHGMGKASLPKLREALVMKGLKFKENT